MNKKKMAARGGSRRAVWLLLVLILALLVGCSPKKDMYVLPELTEAGIYADIIIEDYGVITVKLDPEAAPITVENFVKLANEGFYNGLTFHRIMEGFMMQGGDPMGTGQGGSDEKIKGEFTANGVQNSLKHTAGAISMARSGSAYETYLSYGYTVEQIAEGMGVSVETVQAGLESGYNSGSCQFFIVHETSSHLDGNYACFGYVVSGMELVNKVCTDAKPTDDNGTIPADAQPVIRSVSIREIK